MRRTTLGTLAAGILVTSTGCVAWRPQTAPVAELLASQPQDVIKVATSDSGKGVLVYQPKVQGDTLTGHPSETAIQRLNIPLRNITTVSTRYRHIGKSLLAGIAIVGGILVYGLLQSLNGGVQ